jgi:predicted dinucleotide-binding enzyme
MDIGIIGSGHIGSTLASFSRARTSGVDCEFSWLPASLVAQAADTGPTAATMKQAARAKDMVIIAVREKSYRADPVTPPGNKKSLRTRGNSGGNSGSLR